MRVTVLVPAALRTETDGAGELSVDLGDGADLSALLRAIADRWPRLGRRLADEQGQVRRYVNIYIDGEDCRSLSGVATPLADGARVQVIPSVAGG